MMHPRTVCTDFLWQDHGDDGLLLEQEGGTNAVNALLASLCDVTGREGAWERTWPAPFLSRVSAAIYTRQISK